MLTRLLEYSVLLSNQDVQPRKKYTPCQRCNRGQHQNVQKVAYDKAFNGLLALMLEKHTQRLIDSPAFKEANPYRQTQNAKNLMSELKSYTRERMGKGYKGAENYHVRLLKQKVRVTKRYAKKL